MTQLVAVVVTRGDDEGYAAQSIGKYLGYRVIVLRVPTTQSIASKAPDVILIDWAPTHITKNEQLVHELRSNAVVREVPICLFYSSEEDVQQELLGISKVAAAPIPAPRETYRRVLERIGAQIPPPEQTHTPGLTLMSPLIHPSILGVAKPRFDSGQYADAAEAAMKEVNARVKELWTAKGHPEKDGKALMLSAFTPNLPAIRLDDLSTESGRNTQEGYMHLFAGALQGIRNPKSHGNIIIGPDRCLLFLFLASLLMSKLDDAAAL